jgi:hypothetical protein
MSDRRKPWMVPVQYNDDRFMENTPAPGSLAPQHGPSDNGEERDERDIEEILRRPDRVEEEREYECKDTTPVNYDSGPHDQEFGVEDHDFNEPDAVPVDYNNGPHEEEFGIDDDEELEPLDGEAEFPEI